MDISSGDVLRIVYNPRRSAFFIVVLGDHSYLDSDGHVRRGEIWTLMLKKHFMFCEAHKL